MSDSPDSQQHEPLIAGSKSADVKRLWSLLLETAPDAMLIVDEHGAILLANSQTGKLFGYSREELIGQRVEMLVPSRFRDAHIQHRGEFYCAPQPRPMTAGLDLYGIRRDGSEFPVEISLSPLKTADGMLVASSLRDVSAQKRSEQELRRAYAELDQRVLQRTAELEAVTRELRSRISLQEQAQKELRQSEECLRLLVEGTRDYAILMLDPAGVVVSWNIGAERIFGLTAEEAIGSPVGDLYAEDPQVEPAHRALEQAAASGRFEEETWRTTKDGRSFRASTVTTALRDDEGHLHGFSRITRDMTEKHALEQQLRHAQKLEAVGRLAGGVAHEFNNAATAILGYSTLIFDNVQDDDKLRHYAEEIQKAGQRAAGVTRQLLAFSRQQILQPTTVNLNDVVSDMEKMLRRLIGENIRVLTVLDPYLNSVTADPSSIAQVIVNLALNARDAMPEGGDLVIETSNVDVDAAIATESQQIVPGPHVRLRVSDTGTGLDKQAAAHLFEPFFTTKPVGSGTGLGLSTVYGIVKQTGGGILVFSQPGRGTTFEVYFPRQEQVAVKPVLFSLVKNPTGGSETILVVEDDSSLRWLTCQILAQFGYSVLNAPDATRALAIASERAGDLDLVISDVIMPRQSGHQLADQVRARYPHIKVLLMSGHMAEIAQQDHKHADLPFLEKPFTPEALALKVREVLDQDLSVRLRKKA